MEIIFNKLPSSGCEEGKLVFSDRGIQWGTFLSPVRDKLIQRPGKGWLTDSQKTKTTPGFKASPRQDVTSHG